MTWCPRPEKISWEIALDTSCGSDRQINGVLEDPGCISRGSFLLAVTIVCGTSSRAKPLIRSLPGDHQWLVIQMVSCCATVHQRHHSAAVGQKCQFTFSTRHSQEATVETVVGVEGWLLVASSKREVWRRA